MASSQSMSDHVSCGVCMEKYDRTDHIPKLLPCQHTFCLACLLSLQRNYYSMFIECPMCRSKHEGSPRDFTTNRVAMDIAEELQQQASQSLSCSTHADMDSVLVCVDCLTGICATCAKKHKDHQLEALDDAKTLLRERLVDETGKQQSALKIEMTSASSVREITRAEDDIKEMCALLVSVITKWQNDQLSIVGEIKTKAAKREQEMKVQNAKLEAILQNDYTISTLIRHLRNKEIIFCQSPRGNSYNFVTARETMLTSLTSVLTSENLVNSKFLQDQTEIATPTAISSNQCPQSQSARQIRAGAFPTKRDNQGRNVLRHTEQPQPQKDPAYVRKEKLQAVLSDTRKVPSYWTQNASSSPGVFHPLNVIEMEHYLVDVDTKTYAAVEHLMTGSWVQQSVGQGASSVGFSHSNIQVQKVQRIENPYTYLHYHNTLKRACKEALKCNYPAITSIDNEPEVLTATLNIPELEAIRLREVNEYFLFCGAPEDKMSDVVKGYYDKSGLFGRGLYLSESSTKANQDAVNPTTRARAGGPLCMVVYRAILGHIYHQKGLATYERPPCRNRRCHEKKCAHIRYDSVMGTERDEGVRLFREFMLFDRNHYYPEFLVTYTRI